MSEIIVAADLNHYGNDQMNRLYSTQGIAPTLLVVSDGGREIKIVERGEEELRKVKVNDLFCGCGGMGLGFKQAGFEIAGAWDFDSHAVKSYAHNVGEHVQQANVLEMVHTDLPFADVWTYGAPCQAFSIAGNQLGMMFKCTGCGHEQMFDGENIIDRNTPCEVCYEKSEPKDIRGILFFEVMRLLKETRANNLDHLPSMIMLENVKGISKFLDVIEYEYKKRGYKLIERKIYNSKWQGVAQNRERYFLVGIRDDIEKKFVMPEQQTDHIPLLKYFLDDEVDEKYYLSEDKLANIIEPTEDGVKVRQATKLGYDIAVDGDSINIAHPKSKTRRGRVGKQVAQTLLTGSEQIVYVDNKYRRLSPREYGRLQGFGENFEIIVSDAQAYKQFGNAVTVNVAQFIAERMRMFLLSL